MPQVGGVPIGSPAHGAAIHSSTRSTNSISPRRQKRPSLSPTNRMQESGAIGRAVVKSAVGPRPRICDVNRPRQLRHARESGQALGRFSTVRLKRRIQ